MAALPGPKKSRPGTTGPGTGSHPAIHSEAASEWLAKTGLPVNRGRDHERDRDKIPSLNVFPAVFSEVLTTHFPGSFCGDNL